MKQRTKAQMAEYQRNRRNKSVQDASGLKNSVTPDVTPTLNVTPKLVTPVICNTLPANFGQIDCTCLHCQANRSSGSKHTINHGQAKTIAELASNELNRQPLPGDNDYAG